MTNRNHHHERTGHFLSNQAIKGFAVRPHAPAVDLAQPVAPQQAPNATQAPAVPARPVKR